METLAAAASLACLAASSASVVLSMRAVREARKTTQRLKDIGEANVRAIMEEGGEASIACVLETFDRLRRGGVLADDALKAAREMCRR